MPKVFISHSWADNDIARKIAEYIKRVGAEIWIDYARITGGEGLPDRINEALEWCDTLMLLWSQSAAKSYYVKLEWQGALDLKKRINACLIDDVKRPAILRGLLYIDFQNFDQGYRELCRALKLKISEAKAPEAPIQEKPKKEKLKIESAIEAAQAKKQPVVQPERLASLTRSFRSTPKELSYADVNAMLKKYNFYCKDDGWNKEYSNPNSRGFASQFESKTIKSDKVVTDDASSLMWQQGGSANHMTFEAAKSWIADLNKKGYAGYHDWRLPTLEEAMSLMEPTKLNGDLYIDPNFDATQRWIWTFDQLQGESQVWVVNFDNGVCSWGLFSNLNAYVRAVCSGQSSTE